MKIMDLPAKVTKIAKTLEYHEFNVRPRNTNIVNPTHSD